MRLRDKWFPENTYRRYYLRKFNNILHGRFYVLKEKNYIRASKPRLTERWFPEGTLIRRSPTSTPSLGKNVGEIMGEVSNS